MGDFQGTVTQELIKNLILSASGFGVGITVYLVFANICGAIQMHGWERRLNIAYAVARTGFIIVIFLVAEAVFHLPEPIEVHWRTLLYTAGILMVAIGYLGVAVESRHKKEPV